MAKLKRDLNLFFVVMAGVGIILGAGIYVLIGQAAGVAGTAVWISFGISAVIAAFTGLSYAELSSMFSKDDGEYAYGLKAFGRYIAFLVAFLIVFEGIISSAAVALGFGGYFDKLVGGGAVLIAAILVIVFSYVSFHGIKESAILNLICTIVEAGGLLFIIAIAWNNYGTVNYLEMAHGWTGIFEATALIFFAFVGFEAIVKLAEETKNPQKTIPKALLWSIGISTVIYMLVALAAVSVIPWQQLGQSASPLADVAAAILGSKAFLVLSIIALFSTGNTVLILLLTTSRMMYGLGAQVPALHKLHHVHSWRKTPWLAVLITGILCLAFVFIGEIKYVASTSNFTIFSTFILVNLSLIWLRYKLPKAKRGFKVPLSIGKFPILAAIGALTSFIMLFFLDLNAFLSGLGLVALATVVYFMFCHSAKKIKCKACRG